MDVLGLREDKGALAVGKGERLEYLKFEKDKDQVSNSRKEEKSKVKTGKIRGDVKSKDYGFQPEEQSKTTGNVESFDLEAIADEVLPTSKKVTKNKDNSQNNYDFTNLKNTKDDVVLEVVVGGSKEERAVTVKGKNNDLDCADTKTVPSEVKGYDNKFKGEKTCNVQHATNNTHGMGSEPQSSVQGKDSDADLGKYEYEVEGDDYAGTRSTKSCASTFAFSQSSEIFRKQTSFVHSFSEMSLLAHYIPLISKT
ncbi:hypothetical protein PoB_005685600 [Plakobranchus ocellatus]|uniref:Uncharacterized protein n=1 Tax=Plakobranchus ocellatus TaxID=259542 RepID=A0AAV4CC85_9GAST|nr:hypothetical protein PoB_005685600 [Plakobranchus ocellatus]